MGLILNKELKNPANPSILIMTPDLEYHWGISNFVRVLNKYSAYRDLLLKDTTLIYKCNVQPETI